MILKASCRAPGGLAAHLLRTDTNETVAITGSRGVEPDVEAALMAFTIMGATATARRPLLHIAASPSPDDPPMTAGQWQEFWALYEREFALGDRAHVEVTHVKHGRRHVHRVYCRVHPDTGRVPSDSYMRIRNEYVARMTELQLGVPLTVGKFHRQVMARIRKERPELVQDGRADNIREPRVERPVLGPDEMQQAERVGRDARVIRAAIFRAFSDSGRDWKQFARQLDALGLSIASGTKAVLVVDDATGMALPLARVLRTEAKAAGVKLRIREADLKAAFGRAQAYDEVREAGFERAERRYEREVESETFVNAYSALAEAEIADIVRIRNEQNRIEWQRQRDTLKARREAIRARYRSAAIARRRRIDTAFRYARLARSSMGRFAILTAGVLVAASGGGIPALVLGYIASRTMAPALRTTARFMKAGLRQADDQARAARHRALSQIVPETPAAEEKPRFSFADFLPADRALAGLLCRLYVKNADPDLRAACERVLGAEKAALVRGLSRSGTQAQITVMMRWMPHHRQGREALARKFDKTGESYAAKAVYRNAQQTAGLGLQVS